MEWSYEDRNYIRLYSEDEDDNSGINCTTCKECGNACNYCENYSEWHR